MEHRDARIHKKDGLTYPIDWAVAVNSLPQFLASMHTGNIASLSFYFSPLVEVTRLRRYGFSGATIRVGPMLSPVQRLYQVRVSISSDIEYKDVLERSIIDIRRVEITLLNDAEPTHSMLEWDTGHGMREVPARHVVPYETTVSVVSHILQQRDLPPDTHWHITTIW